MDRRNNIVDVFDRSAVVRRRGVFQILNVFGLLGFLLVNFLANALPLNGKYTGELSDQYPNLFVPAGLTFAIWGLIYILFILFATYQFRKVFRTSPGRNFLDDVGILFFVSCLANMAWIFAWHYEMVALSMAIMVILFLSLLGVYIRLGIGLKSVSMKEKMYVHAPFSIYLGWITIASIANATALLVDAGWGGMGMSEVFWTVFAIGAGTLVTVLILLRRKDIFFAAVPVWAFAGIILKRATTSPLYGYIVVASFAGIVIILITAAASRMGFGGVDWPMRGPTVTCCCREKTS